MTGPFPPFEVTESETGERLDKVLARRFPALGRRAVTELFARGAVRVDGRVAKKGERARMAVTVRVDASGAEPIRPEPDAPLVVVLETAAVVVVAKPAGQPTAPVRFGETGTLASALLGRYPEMADIGYRTREPGLIHRLDTQTSGLVVAARSAPVFEHLRAALSAGQLEKRYLAVVKADGLAASGVVTAPLGPSPEDPRRVVVLGAGDRARVSPSRYRALRTRGPWALVEVVVQHAYRHQIRVHLASIGHPIAGDRLYGGPDAPDLGERHALHAAHVAWAGDDVVPGFAADCALPDALVALVGDG